MRVLKLLLDQGVVVVCAGGGGIPVLRREDGSMVGIEAVIDKDAASALLAGQLGGADALLLLTDVDAVYRDFGTDQSTPLSELIVGEARALDMPAGSMGRNCRPPAILPRLAESAALDGCRTPWPFWKDRRALECRPGRPALVFSGCEF